MYPVGFRNELNKLLKTIRTGEHKNLIEKLSLLYLL
jgi:hypothetical protein